MVPDGARIGPAWPATVELVRWTAGKGPRRLLVGGALAGLVVALAAIVAAVAVAALATPAGAQVDDNAVFDCTADIVDVAGVLDADEIRAAADEVEATVIVRSLNTVPPGVTLPDLVDQIIAECFADDVGDVRGNLAMFSFAVDDRVADVFLGPEMPGGAIPQDLSDTMTARFPDGDFTGGVIAAIDELDQRLGGGGAPIGDGDGDGEGAVDAGAEPDGESSVGGGDGVGGGIAAGALGLAGAGGGGYLLIRRRNRLRARRAALQSATSRPRIRVGAVREQALRLQGQAELWSKTVTGRTAEVLAEMRHRARTATSDTERSAALVGQATPDGIDAASNEQLARAEGRLTELIDALDRSEKSLDELFAFGARLDHLRVALPAKRELLLSELAAADALAAERAAAGWRVDQPGAELRAVRQAVEQAELSGFALDLLSLSEQIEGAEARLFAAHHDLQSLPDRPAAVAQWRQRQAEAVTMERRRIDNGGDLLRAMAEHHDPESWQWTTQFPDRAGDHLLNAEELGDQAGAAAESQGFEEAGRLLEQAGLQLIAADELLDQLEDLAVDLDQARAEAPGIVAEARVVADQFGAFVERHRRDLDADLRQRPHHVEEAIAALEAELAKPRPNHLRVARAGERLNQELDGLLAIAVDQHERMESLRRQADREVARARRSIQRTRQSIGWQLFPSSEARDLDRIEQQLARLPVDPAERLAAARDVTDEAVEIQEHVIARRRRQNNWVVVGGSGGGFGSSSGGSSGRSFGGGGSSGRSFGGGGSAGRSFGGGRGGGSW